MSRKMIILGFLGALIVLGFFSFSKRKELIRARPQGEVESSTPIPSVDETATPTPTPQLPEGATKLAPKDLRKIIVLQSVMEGKNEQDARIEKDLANLSPSVKAVMETLYAETPVEKRHERGMIVLVIGNQISQRADIDFLKTVLMEKPVTGMEENEANYPQIMATRALVEQDRMLRGDPDADKSLHTHILETLRQSTHSPNSKVASDSENAIFYLTGKK